MDTIIPIIIIVGLLICGFFLIVLYNLFRYEHTEQSKQHKE